MPSLIGVVIVTFLLTRVLPGDPAAYFAGPAATKEAVEQVRVKLGLDKPLLVQFVRYVGDLSQGDLGASLTTGQPVATEIRTRLPASAELTLLGLLLAVATAVPLGIMAAIRPGSLVDHACRIITTAGVSLPVFFTGLILVYVFYYRWAGRPLRSAGSTCSSARRTGHRLLSDRQPDRPRLRDFRRASSSSSCRRSRWRSSRSRRSRA